MRRQNESALLPVQKGANDVESLEADAIFDVSPEAGGIIGTERDEFNRRPPEVAEDAPDKGLPLRGRERGKRPRDVLIRRRPVTRIHDPPESAQERSQRSSRTAGQENLPSLNKRGAGGELLLFIIWLHYFMNYSG